MTVYEPLTKRGFGETQLDSQGEPVSRQRSVQKAEAGHQPDRRRKLGGEFTGGGGGVSGEFGLPMKEVLSYDFDNL